MQSLSQKQIHARLVSTRDLLIELACESQTTLRTMSAGDTDADTWFEYRKLTTQIQTCASDATLLAASTDPKHCQPIPPDAQPVTA